MNLKPLAGNLAELLGLGVELLQQRINASPDRGIEKFQAAGGAQNGTAFSHDAADTGVVHLDDVLLGIDEPGAASGIRDVLLQPDDGFGISIDHACRAHETAVSIADAKDGDFMAIEAEPHDGAEEGVHAWGIATTEEDEDGFFWVIVHEKSCAGGGDEAEKTARYRQGRLPVIATRRREASRALCQGGRAVRILVQRKGRSPVQNTSSLLAFNLCDCLKLCQFSVIDIVLIRS